MTVTKEAIEAAWAAYQKFGWSTQEGIEKALEAALPFLPIAVEGKDWKPISSAPKDGTEVDLWCVRHTGKPLRVTDMWWTESTGWRNGNRDTKIEALARSATHWRLPPSSPGKDGGQEVEAVAVLGYVREAGLRSLAERNHTSIYPSPDEERGYTIPVYAQPASTALVEWKVVPDEITTELLAAATKGRQVLAYENGRYYNAWLEFEQSEGGWLWFDEADSEPNPSHYCELPPEPALSASQSTSTEGER